MSRAKKRTDITALIAEREKLRAEWHTNRQARIKLEIKLDRATTNLAKAVGLEPPLDGFAAKH